MEKQIKEVFLCHASEDKNNVVRPLAEALKKAGISYWLDEAEIRWGCDIFKSINEGLKTSQFVIVVLSKNFLQKKWPQTELSAAMNDELSSEIIKVLPLIVGSNSEKEEILREISLVKGKHYLSWNGNTDDIVERLKYILQSSDETDVQKEKNYTSKKTVVNGIKMILACQENDSIQKCEEWIWTKDNSVMIKIPAGKFWRGSELGEGSGNEMPPTQIYLDEYYIDKYPVTNKQFAQFVLEYERVHGCPFVTTAEKNGGVWECVGNEWIRLPKKWSDYHFPDTKEHPVVGVSVEDAEAYCDWNSKRLPSEAEWERAARGDEASIYPWGNERPNPKMHAKYLVAPRERTGTTNVFEDVYREGRSPFGCFHMAGNVWEWCKDYYDFYPKATNLLKNPKGPQKEMAQNNTEGQKLYVNRGGSWIDNWCALRCAYRSGDPSDAYFHVGFRCVLDLEIE